MMNYHSVILGVVSLFLIDVLPAENLKEQLDARSAKFAEKAPAELLASQQKALESLRATAIVEKALKVDDLAPNFTLKDHEGRPVRLSTLLKQGPVVLTWYRGGWCPYCNIALQSWVVANPEIRKLGATLVALTPELPDATAATVKEHGLPFVVLTDLNHTVAKQFGLVFELDADTAKRYEERFQLSRKNGVEAGTKLPLPATYVITPDRKIAYAFLDIDYKKRAEPADVLNVLTALSK